MVKERKCRRVHRFQQKTVHIVSIVSSRIEANGHTRRSLFDQFSSHLTYYPFFSESKTSLFFQSIVSKESVKRTPMYMCMCIHTQPSPAYTQRIQPLFGRWNFKEKYLKWLWKKIVLISDTPIKVTLLDIVGHCIGYFDPFCVGESQQEGAVLICWVLHIYTAPDTVIVCYYIVGWICSRPL